MEQELSFKRFSDSKQEQIRQFVAYAQLMGLTGKDLVSIGGKLSRIEDRDDRIRRLEIVKSYDIKPVGKDKNSYQRFKIEIDGQTYHVQPDWYECIVKNTKTGRTTRLSLGHDDWGRNKAWQARNQYQFLWELYQGKVTLP